jgi:hypothetical protein
MRTCYIKVRVGGLGNKRRSGIFKYISSYHYNSNPSFFFGFSYMLEEESDIKTNKISFTEDTIKELEKLGGKNFIRAEYKIEWID